MLGDLKFVMSKIQRVVNAVAQDEQDIEYSGITSELVEEGMQTNMFSVPCVSAMRSKRNKLLLQLLKNQNLQAVIEKRQQKR